MDKPKLNLVARIEKKTGNLLLCYHNGRITPSGHAVDRDKVEFYDFKNRYHDEMDYWYYLNKTVPTTLPPGYFEDYIRDWPGFSVPVLRRRLS